MRKVLNAFIVACLLSACSHSPVETTPPVTTEPPVVVTPPAEAKWKAPVAMSKYQIMDEDDGDYLEQLKADTKLVNVELFGTDKKTNEALKAKGVYVVCYYSLSFEDWRPDAKSFPKEAIGKKMGGWNENWSNLSLESLHKFMDKRDDLAKSISCDATEKDNSDDGEAAFNLTKAQLIASSKRRADYAHSIGLGSIFKNTPEIAKEAAEHNDGVFIEEASRYDEVDDYVSWKGKFVGMVEYSSSKAKCLPWAIVQYHSGSEYFKGAYSSCK